MKSSKCAFSLVELLISLIIISLIVAAFAPIMTKKMHPIKTLSGQNLNLTDKCDNFTSTELEGGKCEDCEKCTLCDGDKKCIQCIEVKGCSENQVLSSDKCKCINCNNESEGYSKDCLECTTETCTKCPEGKYPDGKECKDCPENCATCNNENECTSCEEGYYLKDGECLPCATNCLQCMSATQCTKCEDDYTLQNGECVKCTKDVVNCEDYNANCTCSKCAKGFHLDATYPNFCWLNLTFRNAGDEGGPTIPPEVNWCEVGDSACMKENKGKATCWRGDTSKTGCSEDGEYPGCGRTVCNYWAAELICASNMKNGRPMYIPRESQAKAIREGANKYGPGIWSDKYALCHPDDKNNDSEICPLSPVQCAQHGDYSFSTFSCFPHDVRVVTDDGDAARLGDDLYVAQTGHEEHTPVSVRCSWD